MIAVFDFDGTLVDSMPALEQAAVRIISRLYAIKYAADARKMYRETIGMSFPEQLAEMFPDRIYSDLNKYAAESFRKEQETVYENVGLRPYVKRALTLLRDEGIHCAVCSSSPRSLTGKVRTRLLPGLIDTNKGREDGTKLMQIARYFERVNGWFVGDAIRDGTYATWVNVNFMGVGGTFPRSAFRTAGYDFAPDLLEVAQEILRSPEIRSKTRAAKPTHISGTHLTSSPTSA